MTSKMYPIIFVTFVSLILIVPPSVITATETSFEHSYPAAEWNYQGNDVPETYWTPYLPLVAQELTRFRIGFRFSTGTIAVKCPVKLTFKYDTNNAQSGKDLPIKVKAELIPASYKTFESAFGLYIPNEFQVGFIGISGVPDFLPWYTLPWDLCGILNHIPGLPQEVSQKIGLICLAIDNVGVNMQTQDALPLPGVASYHDKRTLLEFKLADLCKNDAEKAAFKNNLGISIFNGLSNRLGPAKMSKLLFLIEGFKNLNEAGATEFLTDKCISAAGGIMSFASISVVGDPYFSVEGVELNVLLRIYIPNGKGSGTYPLTFTSSGQEQTVTFRDITPFVQSGDKLVVVADEINYRFKLKQGLIPKVGISLKEFSFDSGEKYITLTTAKGNFSETDFKGEIPLVPSTDPIQSLRANPGCTSAQVNWTSPIVPLKGTIKVFDGNTLVKTVTESTFRPAHNNIITDLVKQKTYRFEVSGATESGQTIQGGSITATTKETCQPRNQDTTCNSLTFSTNPTASAGQNYADFSWTTNERASTEVLISPSPDLSANYIACVKKDNGQVNQGWVTQGGVRELVTSHSIRITDLEPGTKYYYNVVSWTFKNNNPTDDPINRIGYVSDITTQALPAQPSMRVSVIHQSQVVADATVNVTKVGDASYHASVVTPANGMTQPLMLEAGKSYIFKVVNSGCYQDYTSPSVPIAANAQGEQPPFTINLLAKPPLGAYVYDTGGRPISGATATIPGHTATTNASGYYSFGEVWPTSNVTVTVTKSGYITAQVPGKVAPCGRTRTFTIDNCVMKKTAATLTAYVKKQDSTAVAGATVTVKEGSQTLSTASTDSQGKATITLNFSNTQEHSLSVTATPPTSLAGADPATENTKLAVEGQQSVSLIFIVAPPDTQGPVISDISFLQTTPVCIQISFNTNEQGAVGTPEVQLPNGQMRNFNWYNASSFSGGKGAYKIDISNHLFVPGVYKIKIKAKDTSNNQSETNFMDATLFGGNLWKLRLSGNKVTSNSITVSWDKYPYTSGFGKYLLTLNCPGTGAAPSTFDVTDINTTTYTFSNLMPQKSYQIFLTAKTPAGEDLTQQYSLGTTTSQTAATQTTQAQGQPQSSTTAGAQQTGNVPPVIRGFEPTPKTQEVNKNITVTAKITDSDSQIKKVILRAIYIDKDTKKESQIATQDYKTNSIKYSHTFTLNQPGSYYLTLEAKDESSATEETIEYEVLPASGPSKEEEALQKKEEEPLQKTELTKGDISLAVQQIQEPVYAKQKVAVSATIKNDSKSNITGGKLKFYIDDKPYGSPKTFALKAGETRKVDVSFTPLKTGTSVVKWELVVPEGFINDSVPENNLVKQSINVLPKPQPQSSAQTEQEVKVTTGKATPKIDIKKITLEAEEKGIVPTGQPLIVLVEVNASDNFAGPFTVNLELRKGQEKQKFTEAIEKLKQDSNSFKWDLIKEPEEGSYALSVEILNSELKLRDRSTKTFRVGEKKVGTKQ